jgi:membrane-bound lytic murein transglycosylase D
MIFVVAGESKSHKQQAQIVSKSSKPVKKLASVPALDSETREFDLQTSMIQNAQECFPVYIKDVHKVGILYLYCSDEALELDGKQVALTDDFTVTPRIARRFNFWRRVYSLWSGSQYVLHSSVWPEVAFEALDGGRLGSGHGPVRTEIKVKKVARERRGHYKKMLLSMHRHRKQPERFTPAMQRVARIMAHIPNHDKYKTAAYTLRTQRGQRTFIAKGLERAPKYLQHIQDNFEKHGVPGEIALLAFVESSFNLKAKSKVGASGVYQIMPATGRQYLKLYGGVDERNDPIKASRAAAKLLKMNHKLLGNWPLAITAYNHGVGGVRRGVKTVGSNQVETLIERYYGRAFKFASRNFYTSYLGILATMKDHERIFHEIKFQDPMQFRTVKLRKATSIKTIRKKHGASVAEIRDMNPDIARWVISRQGTLPRGYEIKLPVSDSEVKEAEAEAEVTKVELIPNS